MHNAVDSPVDHAKVLLEVWLARQSVLGTDTGSFALKGAFDAERTAV